MTEGVLPAIPAVRARSGGASFRAIRRRIVNLLVICLSGACVVAVLIPLASILYEAVANGGAVLFTSGFFTGTIPDPCSPISCTTAGIGPAIQGTIVVVGLAVLVASAIGVCAAVFTTEYRTGLLGRAISFTADILTGVPSILMGLFIYSYWVFTDPQAAFNVVNGVAALSFLMIPVVVRTTEEALRTVPNSLREAALALGIPRWRISLQIVVATALPGIVTGTLLAGMRAAGDAAPLLVTIFGSRLYITGLNQPAEALPLLIFNFGYAQAGPSNYYTVAWGATLFLIILVLTANILSRWSIERMVRRMSGK